MSKMPPPAVEQWSLYSAAQNLPAVLNDPNRGKQTNFFVKTWGDTFVEKSLIERSPFLPEVTYAHFDAYHRKIGKRYKRHLRMLHASLETAARNTKNDLIPNGGDALVGGGSTFQSIPAIFLRPDFPLNSPEVFAAVFHSNNHRQSDHALQEQLSHYLDIVEVHIARQVSQKSGAFFHAMTSHDTIMEQMGVASDEVRVLRAKVQKVDKTLAKDSLILVGLARSRANHAQLIDKLKLMSIVLQTQPTLQLLLSASDYVAALELITGTQEVLARDLAGVTSLRHLPSQLKEMSKLIDKMLSTEFERYAAADLHRPLERSDDGVLEPERLISLVAGLLRQNHLQFLETYKQEAVTAAQTLLKQLVIEQLANVEDDQEHCLTGLGDVMAPTMDATNWLNVLNLASDAFGKLLQRVKSVHDVIKETADTSAGINITSTTLLIGGSTEKFLSLEDYNRVECKLKDLLITICDYCHERLASLISTQSDKQQLQITAQQITELSALVEHFSSLCQMICGRQSAALRAAFKIQAGSYIHRFHSQRKTKLTMLLDAERWKAAEVPAEIQLLLDKLSAGGVFKSLPSTPVYDDDDESERPKAVAAAPTITLGAQNYMTIGAVLILIRLVSEYCVCAYDVQLMASVIGRNLAELLNAFNSRSCQLVLGAGALRTAGLKTITSTNLALTSRSLQLVLWMIPYVRRHFNALCSDLSMSGFDIVEKDIGDHIQQLETKILSIMNSLLGDQLNEWDAKPPVPSKAFRNVSRHLMKLHEAVSTVLPDEQVSDIYTIIHKNFKTRLREHLLKMNIQNNGGPQHGVVTTEIIFYLETMKTLKVLPDKYLSDKAMDDIWLR